MNSTFILVSYYGADAAYYNGKRFVWDIAQRSKKVATRHLEQCLHANQCLIVQEVVTRPTGLSQTQSFTKVCS